MSYMRVCESVAVRRNLIAWRQRGATSVITPYVRCASGISDDEPRKPQRSWFDKLVRFATGKLDRLQPDSTKPKKSSVIDTDTSSTAKTKENIASLPTWTQHWSNEFPPESPTDRRWRHLESTRRIARIAADRVLEPSAVALLGISASFVVSIGVAEGTLLCKEMPFVESMDAATFVGRYALEQLLPSTVSSTQDANLVATSLGYDASSLLRTLDPKDPEDASVLLALGFCETMRRMSAGFMFLAQLVRVGAIGAQAPALYEERVKAGREPPILGFEKNASSGLVIRLCGRESNIITTSMRRMGWRVFPVLEEPVNKHSFFISQYSRGYRVPVFWSMRPDRYGYSHSWKNFPVEEECLMRTTTGKKVLVLEADATNANDPLALGDQALDLTLDDTSQGFRRIEERYKKMVGVPFRALKVYLGNSLEVEHSGGGHTFTLRHRVKYSKEVDILIDSRAPILREVLRWCNRVTAGSRGKDSPDDEKKIILFQTSSRQYFLSLKLLMQNYGYEIRDPLDWHVLGELSTRDGDKGSNVESLAGMSNSTPEELDQQRSLLGILNDDSVQSSAHTLQEVARLSRLPRMIYYGKTAETVSAVQALVDSGGIHAGKICALLDREDGTRFLEATLAKDQVNFIKRGDFSSSAADGMETTQMHIICSSAIYDNLFRQVRGWVRMGYSTKDIQKDLDGRYQTILRQSKEIDEALADVSETEQKQSAEETNENSSEDMTDSDDDGGGDKKEN